MKTRPKYELTKSKAVYSAFLSILLFRNPPTFEELINKTGNTKAALSFQIKPLKEKDIIIFHGAGVRNEPVKLMISTNGFIDFINKHLKQKNKISTTKAKEFLEENQQKFLQARTFEELFKLLNEPGNKQDSPLHFPTFEDKQKDFANNMAKAIYRKKNV